MNGYFIIKKKLITFKSILKKIKVIGYSTHIILFSAKYLSGHRCAPKMFVLIICLYKVNNPKMKKKY